MLVKDLMNRGVVIIDSNDSRMNAISTVNKLNIGRLLVMQRESWWELSVTVT